MIHTGTPFHDRTYWTVADAFQNGFNESYWRHAIVFSEGNEWNVTETSVRGRLKYLKSRLARTIFGNRWRHKGKIIFFIFKHGADVNFNAHYHALMGIEGSHDWSDQQIADTLRCIDSELIGCRRYEKPIHVDHDWKKGNHMHSYVSKYVQHGSDGYFII
jgi:hypothetical protein